MVTEHQILPDLAGLFEALHADGRAIIGPTVRGNAIVPAEIDEPSDLPYGGAANVDAGQYRLRHDAEPLAFTHTSGPQSWKQVVHPAEGAARWVAGFTFPDFTIAHTLLALTGSGQYPLDRGQPVTSAGAAFPVQDFERHIDESHMPHSTALHATLDGGPYLTGPLARYALNHAALSPLAREAARSAGLEVARDNPFRSIVARAVELV